MRNLSPVFAPAKRRGWRAAVAAAAVFAATVGVNIAPAGDASAVTVGFAAGGTMVGTPLATPGGGTSESAGSNDALGLLDCRIVTHTNEWVAERFCVISYSAQLTGPPDPVHARGTITITPYEATGVYMSFTGQAARTGNEIVVLNGRLTIWRNGHLREDTSASGSFTLVPTPIPGSNLWSYQFAGGAIAT